jgi:putative ABC transport system permease protein
MATWVWPMIWRDLRSGSLRWLWLAVALAVAALSSVGLFADRIERGLHRDASQLMGADLVVLGDQPIPDALANQATTEGLRHSRTAIFPSMGRAPDELGGETRLLAVKAVGEQYPLRGHLTLGRLLPSGEVEPTGPAPVGGPAAGTVWVDPGVLIALRLKVGDALYLGESRFTIAAVISAEPDRGTGFVNFSPRVMLRWADLAATQLIQPASRVTWRLLVAGAARSGDAGWGAPPGTARVVAGQGRDDARALAQYTRLAKEAALKTRGLRVETLDDGRPEMRSTIDRAGLFLRLVALLAALMSAVVVAMVARDFAQRRLDDCALLRVMGVSQRAMVQAYVLELTVVAGLASLAGLLVGALFHQVFVWLLADLVKVSLPAPGWWPVALALGVGMTLTLGFGMPPLLQLAQVPALRVLRRQLGAPRGGAVSVLLGGVLALVALLTLVVRDTKMALIALGGMSVAVLVLAGLCWLILWAIQRWLKGLGGQRAPVVLAQAMRDLVAQPMATTIQVCALSLGLLSVFLLILIRTDLIASWRNATPPDAPNRFVINIQPDQVDAFRKDLSQGGIKQYDWYPMARARLVAINGQSVRPESYKEERARQLVDREFNLSHAAQPPSHNEMVGGRYQATATPADEFSVEEGLAKTLGLKLGDTLQFDMGGQLMKGRMTSLRKVDWSSMHVNFFVMVPVAQVAGWPESFIAAFRVPPGGVLDRTLVGHYPNITLVDVSLTVAQVQRVLDQVIAAVEFLFVFTLAAGLLVLLAGLWSSRERRAQDWAIMRAMGASRAHLQRVQNIELVLVGVLAGGLAAVAALGIGGALAHQVFDFPWQPPWWGPLAGSAVGAALVSLAGWWSLRGLLERPVLATLRRAAD